MDSFNVIRSSGSHSGHSILDRSKELAGFSHDLASNLHNREFRMVIQSFIAFHLASGRLHRLRRMDDRPFRQLCTEQLRDRSGRLSNDHLFWISVKRSESHFANDAIRLMERHNRRRDTMVILVPKRRQLTKNSSRDQFQVR
jgi:hypothetical protein